MRDLLGIQHSPTESLPEDGAGGEGFDNAAETLFLSPLHAEQYREAAREVLRYAFETLALERVTAEAAARNFASLRILAKLGFKHIESFIDETDGERCERLALDGDIGSSLLASNPMPDC